MNLSRWTGAAAVVALLGLAGCGSTVKLNDDVPVESRSPTAVPPQAAGGAAGAQGAGTAQSQVTTVDLGKGDDLAKVGRVVYFDYDSFSVRDDARPVIEAHAKALARAKNRKLVVEGHTDERGGREYNLALGQKRAEAVAKSLVLLGAADSQIEAVSFGKERPADEGHDEAAWARNRRAELKDR